LHGLRDFSFGIMSIWLTIDKDFFCKIRVYWQYVYNEKYLILAQLPCFTKGECSLSASLETIEVASPVECMEKCLEHIDCSHYNFKEKGSIDSCELLQNCEFFSLETCENCYMGRSDCKGLFLMHKHSLNNKGNNLLIPHISTLDRVNTMCSQHFVHYIERFTWNFLTYCDVKLTIWTSGFHLHKCKNNLGPNTERLTI